LLTRARCRSQDAAPAWTVPKARVGRKNRSSKIAWGPSAARMMVWPGPVYDAMRPGIAEAAGELRRLFDAFGHVMPAIGQRLGLVDCQRLPSFVACHRHPSCPRIGHPLCDADPSRTSSDLALRGNGVGKGKPSKVTGKSPEKDRTHRRPSRSARFYWFGEVAEWSIAPHSKCGILARVSGVRIPPSPPVAVVTAHMAAESAAALQCVPRNAARGLRQELDRCRYDGANAGAGGLWRAPMTEAAMNLETAVGA
jgi:hypothetical protein